jgi:hypothetical protein
MSFDIFFMPCRYGTKPVKQKNTVTGREESVLPNEPLTTAQLQAVREVLKKAAAPRSDDFGCYVVEFDDGGGADVFGRDLSNGCMVAVRGITPKLMQFLIDLLKAGNWVMCPAMEETVTITCSPECVKDMPEDFPKVVICNSADELGVLLTDGFQAWKKYRDVVTRSIHQDEKKKNGRGPK